jgi:hypothetical protein
VDNYSLLSKTTARLYRQAHTRKEARTLMAEIAGNLWELNFAKITIVDVTDDYRLMQPPLPSDFYPVLKEIWLPRHRLAEKLAASELLEGYLYDWHERPEMEGGQWFVGVVHADLLEEPQFKSVAMDC